MNVWVLTRRSCDEARATYEEPPDIYLNKFDAYSDKDREASECAAELMKKYPGQDVKLTPHNERTTVTRKGAFGGTLELHTWAIWELEL